MSKPLLILLPGLLNNRALWQYIAPNLQSEFDLILPEIHHHDTLQDSAVAILSTLDRPFALAGFSMGGYVALEMLRLAPELVSHFALINSRAAPDGLKEQQQRKLSIKTVQMASSKFMGITPRLMRRLVHPIQYNNAELYDIVYNMAQEIGPEGFIRQQTANIQRDDQSCILRGFTKPTLLISGSHDHIIPSENTFALQDQVPNAETVLLDQVGHLAPLEAPEAVLSALQKWLRR